MSKSQRTHARLQYWLPRAWGFAAGGSALLLGGLIVTLLFTDASSRDASADMEFVYPYDL